MSSLPSLLTSAMATPSERKVRSMIVFFQEVDAGGLALSLAGVSAAGSSDRAGRVARKKTGATVRKRMGDLGVVGSASGSDYPPRWGGRQQGRGHFLGARRAPGA